MQHEYRSRMLEIVDDLKRQGVAPLTAAPPVYRLLWRAGLHVRPPIYQSFWAMAVWNGVIFGLLYPIATWLLTEALDRLIPVLFGVPPNFRGEVRSLHGMIIEGIVGGAIFGLAFTAWIRRRLKHVKLPPIAN